MRSLLRAIAVATFYVVTLTPAAVWAHSDAITKCNHNIKYERAVKVGEDALLGPTGLYAEHYDTNGDGKFDVVTFSHTDLGMKGHRVNPVFWMVDLDHDGTPDALYIDKQGLGKCKDIVLYQDLTKGMTDDEPMDRGRKL